MSQGTILQLLHTNVSDLVPEGRRLPEPVWRQRHHGMIALLVLHAAGFFTAALVRDETVQRALVDAGPIAAAAVLAALPRLRRGLRAGVAVIGLLSCSALLVHLTDGLIESHFHFFVMVAFISLYQQWLTFLLAFGYVLLHHAVIGALDPAVVYNHAAAQQRPLLWTGVHGGFVLAASVANMVAWRLIEKEHDRTERVLDSTAEGIYEVDLKGRITFANAAVGRVLGREVADVLGLPDHDALGHDAADPDRADRAGCLVCACIARGDGATTRTELRRADGSTFPVECSGQPVMVKDQRVGSVVTFRDLTVQQQLTRQALYDSLTGLANRSLLLEHLQQALARLDRRRCLTAVLFCDLDGFKPINDTLGHAAGDELLVAVAGRLQEAVRAHDTVARFGGDEFVVLCTDLEAERDVLAIAERFRAAIATPFLVAGQHVSVSTSIGITMSGDPEATPEMLLGEADAAMYRAKHKGRNRIEVFDEELRARALRRLRMEGDLRRAVVEGELRVHYQPKVSLRDGSLAGVEALVRWQHPELGLVPPSEFLAVAEECGLIAPLGDWVLEEACRQVQDWRQRHPACADLALSVNLSSKQLAGLGIVDAVRDALARTGTRPELLCLEVGEQVLMEDSPVIVEALHQLKRVGVRLAVDDFGTGWSSLSYLTRLPIDVLKVDRSFVASLHSQSESWSIVAAALGLSRSLGLSAVAEGVEDDAQAAALRDLGCQVAQGFHFAKPQSAEGFESLLEQGAAWPAAPVELALRPRP